MNNSEGEIDKLQLIMIRCDSMDDWFPELTNILST